MLNTSAVVLNYNDRENALKLAERLIRMDAVNHLLIADNSDQDALTGRESVFKSPKADFLKVQNRGYAAGNNEGIHFLENKYGKMDYLIISNPDIEVTEEAIRKCLDFLESHPEYALTAPRMFMSDGAPHPLAGWKERKVFWDLAYSSGLLSRTIGMFHEAYTEDHWLMPYADVDCVAGAFFIARADAMRSVGYFDEKTFLFYEEDILCFKLKRMGFRCAILNDCRFIHREGISKSRNLQKYLTMQKSRIYFHKKYKKAGPLGLAVLYTATAMGIAECFLKSLLGIADNK